jgi:predicted glutamine amidotransferase
MFCHNGYIESFYDGVGRKKIICEIDDDIIVNIMGNTDSEYLFFLILSYIRKGETIKNSFEHAINFIHEIDTNKLVCANIIFTDGKTTVGSRYINDDSIPPSLYYRKDLSKIFLSSEPLQKDCNKWTLVPKNSLVNIYDDIFNIVPI